MEAENKAQDELDKKKALQLEIEHRINNELGIKAGKLTEEEKAVREINDRYKALFNDIREQYRDNPSTGDYRIAELEQQKKNEIAAIRKNYSEKRTVVVEEETTTNAILTQSQFDFLQERSDKLTKKEKAMVTKGYASLSAEDSKALKARYDKLTKADSKAADQRYQEQVKRLEQAQRAEQNLINQRFFDREITAEQHEKALRDITMKYLAEKLALDKANGKDITQIEASIISERMKNRKSDYDEELKQLEARQKEEEQSLSLSLSAQEITEKEYHSKSLEFKMRYLEEKLKLTLESGQDETAALQAIFDAQIEAEKAAYEEMKKLKEDAQKVIAGLDPSAARQQELKSELDKLEELHQAKLLSEEQYEEAVKQLRKKYSDEDLQDQLGNIADYINKANKMMEGASNFVTALKEAESAQLEAQYQKDLTAAGDNAEKREQIEAEYEEKKLDLQKKYADVEMAINIAKTIASGAVAAIRAYAEGGPYAGVILAALIAATTAAEVATIVAQRNAIKSTTISNTSSASSGSTDNTMQTGTRTITGYSEGGNTKRAASDATVVGVVHANEWVAPAWMVRENPTAFADLEQYRVTLGRGRKKLGSGFADGGFAEQANSSEASSINKQDVINAIKEGAKEGAKEGVKEGLQGEYIKALVQYGDIIIAGKKHDNFKNQLAR